MELLLVIFLIYAVIKIYKNNRLTEVFYIISGFLILFGIIILPTLDKGSQIFIGISIFIGILFYFLYKYEKKKKFNKLLKNLVKCIYQNFMKFSMIDEKKLDYINYDVKKKSNHHK